MYTEILVSSDLSKSNSLLTPPVAGADLRAALVASCFRGALPPVDFRAVCLVRAILLEYQFRYDKNFQSFDIFKRFALEFSSFAYSIVLTPFKKL